MNRIHVTFTLFFFLSVPTLVFGGQKIYGKIGYGYSQNNAKDKYNTNSQSSLTQEYMIGYQGNIYSPRLFSYTAEAAFLESATVNNNNEASTHNDSSNINYNFNASALGATNIPITLYATKATNPYSFVTANSSSSYTVHSDTYGISGLVRHPFAEMTYFLASGNSKSNSYSIGETRSNMDYGLGLRKSTSSSSLQFSLAEHNRDYTFESDTPYSWNSNNRDMQLSGSSRLSKTVSMTSAVGYQTSNLSTRAYTGTAGVSWSPTTSYSASLSLSANKMDSSYGSYTGTNLSASSSYRINDHLSTNQSLMLMKMKSDSSESTSTIATLGVNYTTRYENGIVWNSNGNVMGNSIKTVEGNANSSNLTTTTYMVGSSLSKMFRLSDTANFSLNGGVNGSANSNNDILQQYSLTSGFSKNMGNNISYTMSAFATRDIRKSGNSLSSNANMEISLYGIDNRFNYTTRVGMDGTLITSIGAAYRVIKTTEEADYVRFSPHITINYNHRLARRLMLSSSLSGYQDSYSESTNYDGSVGINYALRSISIAAGGRYGVNTSINGERSQNSLFINASRPF